MSYKTTTYGQYIASVILLILTMVATIALLAWDTTAGGGWPIVALIVTWGVTHLTTDISSRSMSARIKSTNHWYVLVERALLLNAGYMIIDRPEVTAMLLIVCILLRFVIAGVLIPVKAHRGLPERFTDTM